VSKLLGLGYFAAIVAVLAAVFFINSYSREHTSASNVDGDASKRPEVRCIRPQLSSGDLVSELAAATSDSEKVKKAKPSSDIREVPRARQESSGGRDQSDNVTFKDRVPAPKAPVWWSEPKECVKVSALPD
jgi:hypothetical protein